MTPTPEQIAALAEALFAQEPHICDPRFLACAAAILAALPDWTLVPTGEVERLRAALEQIRAECDTSREDIAATHGSEQRLLFAVIPRIAHAALAGDAP